MKPIFNDEQLKRASLILESPLAKLSELYSNEIKDLAVVWLLLFPEGNRRVILILTLKRKHY